MSKQPEARGAEQAGAADAAPAGGSDALETEVVDAEVVEDLPGDGDRDAARAPEQESPPGGDGDGAAAPEAEPDPLADALRERAEYLALAQRARADFENFRKRSGAQATEAERRGRATLARELLPAIDNLQRALAAAGVDPAAPDASEDGLAKGVALVYGELRGGLERAGVVAFDPAGERFDPTVHEAISTAPAEGSEAGTVLETLELGYRVDQQVIRPARVVVSG